MIRVIDIIVPTQTTKFCYKFCLSCKIVFTTIQISFSYTNTQFPHLVLFYVFSLNNKLNCNNLLWCNNKIESLNMYNNILPLLPYKLLIININDDVIHSLLIINSSYKCQTIISGNHNTGMI